MTRIALSSVLLALLSVPMSAEGSNDELRLTHHVDLWQVGASDGDITVYDLSYHFTVLEWKQFSFLGAGLGFDVWSECADPLGRRCSVGGENRNYFGSPFLVVPLASIRLTRLGPDGAWSLGTNYVYQFKRQEHALTFGAMITWR